MNNHTCLNLLRRSICFKDKGAIPCLLLSPWIFPACSLDGWARSRYKLTTVLTHIQTRFTYLGNRLIVYSILLYILSLSLHLLPSQQPQLHHPLPSSSSSYIPSSPKLPSSSELLSASPVRLSSFEDCVDETDFNAGGFLVLLLHVFLASLLQLWVILFFQDGMMDVSVSWENRTQWNGRERGIVPNNSDGGGRMVRTQLGEMLPWMTTTAHVEGVCKE